MVSAAEQLARNISLSTFSKAKELQARIWFTLIALVVYRLGAQIPIPGINIAEYTRAFSGMKDGIFGMWNTFSGGAVERMAIFALNVMPYISASIIVQILSTAIPALERLKKEGEGGRKQLNQYTRYLTVVLAIAQASAIAFGLSNTPGMAYQPGAYFIASTIITLVGGTIFIMWLGEQITARGVGNGISLIIFAGIVAELPNYIVQTWAQLYAGQLDFTVILAIIALAVVMVLFIVFIERSQRRLLIQYPKRQQGNRMVGGESSFLPLKVNAAGVIPPIFASSLLMLPNTLATFNNNPAAATGGNLNADQVAAAQSGWWGEVISFIQAYLGSGQPLHIVLYAALIIFFCFFYTSIVFNPEETAENLRKYGGFIPGYRPGKRTAEHLDYVLTRLTVIGSLYIAAVCVLPELLRNQFAGRFYIGGTSLLIVVSVTMDTVAQIQSHLIGHQYEGMIKKSRLGGKKK